MCAAGTLGERRCATSEMPEAKKRGSCSAPGIWARNSGLNSPNTVETLTPTFSNTRPRMTDMVPPPRSSPSGPASRCHSLRSKRPGASSRWVPESSVSMRSNSPQMRSRSPSNEARAAALRWARVASSGSLVGVLVGERIESCGLAEGLAQYHRPGQRDIERAQTLLQRNAQPEVGGVVHRLRHAGAFAAEQQRVVCPEGDVGKALGPRCGQQDEPAGRAIALVGLPRGVAGDAR